MGAVVVLRYILYVVYVFGLSGLLGFVSNGVIVL